MAKYDLKISVDVSQYTTATAPSIGLKNGVFYWATGDTTGDYVGGLIVDGSVDTIDRSVDISETGGFSVDGSAGWSLSGSLHLQDTIDAYGISFTSCPVVIYQGTTAVFTGVIDAASGDETEWNFAAVVKNIALDKTVPPSDTPDGDPVPIVLGSVQKSPCANMQSISDPWVAHDGLIDTQLLLITGLRFAYTDNGTTYVQFYMDDAGSIVDNYLTLFESFAPDPVVARRLVVKISGYDMYMTAYANGYSTVDKYIELQVYGLVNAGIVVYTGSNILLCSTMKIFEFSKICSISEAAIDSPTGFNDLNIYQNIDDNYQRIAGALSEYTTPDFNLFSGKASQGSVGISTVTIPLNGTYGFTTSDSSNLRQADMVDVFDRSFTTYGKYEHKSIVNDATVNFEIGDISSSDLVNEGDYYLVYDYSVSPAGGTYDMAAKKLEIIGTDIYGNASVVHTIGDGSAIIHQYNVNDSIGKAIPVDYYDPMKSVSMFDYIFAVSTDVFTIPENIVTACKEGRLTRLSFKFYTTTSWSHGGDPTAWYTGIQWIGGCVVCRTPCDVEKEIIYADVESGEIYDSGTTDTIENAVSHIVDTYCGSAVPTFSTGSTTWSIGHTITDRRAAADTLADVAKQAFIAMFNGADGALNVNNWLSNTTVAHAFDETNIFRDSIGEWRLQSADDCYNDVTIQYDYDYAADSYRRTIRITNAQEAAFPDITGDWTSFVSGIGTGATAYAAAKTAWEYARASYLAIGTTRPLPASMGQCSWFTDPTWLGGTIDETLSAWKFAAMCAYWFGLPKRVVAFEVSRSILDVGVELLQYATFSDAEYTRDQVLGGWITGISIDQDYVKIGMMLAPAYVMGDIYRETGSATTDIIETGSQTTNIIEG